MSFRITPSNPALPQLDLRTSGPQKDMCLYWVVIPADVGGRIIIVIGEKGLCHMYLEEENKCLLDSWSTPLKLDFWMVAPWVFWCWALLACLVMLLLVLPARWGFSREPRIWADGFMRSRQRRIRLPRFRPTSMSLSWILRWTFSATSKTARVRLPSGT